MRVYYSKYVSSKYFLHFIAESSKLIDLVRYVLRLLVTH